jgi:hypothetical protein
MPAAGLPRARRGGRGVPSARVRLTAALVPALAAGARLPSVAGFVATAGVVAASVGVLLGLALTVGVGVTDSDGLADGLWLGLIDWLGDAVPDVEGCGDADAG